MKYFEINYGKQHYMFMFYFLGEVMVVLSCHSSNQGQVIKFNVIIIIKFFIAMSILYITHPIIHKTFLHISKISFEELQVLTNILAWKAKLGLMASAITAHMIHM